MPALYLDNAATSWPKPDTVLDAMRHWFTDLGVDASRGTTQRHEEVGNLVRALRQKLALLTGVPHKGVVLCSGATTALNLYLKGSLDTGSRVVATAADHSSVVRPIIGLGERSGVQFEFVPCDATGFVDPDAVRRSVAAASTDVFVMTHASNVTGRIQDVAAIAEVCREHEARFVLDAAQTAGRVELAGVDADAFVIPGHKSLMGPPGVGALCLADPDHLPTPLIEGGTGSSRASDHMPDELPAALEAGTPNTPGYLGWLAGIEWVEARGVSAIRQHEHALAARLHAGLSSLADRERLQVVGADGSDAYVAILSLVPADLDPVELAMILEQHDVYTRAGFHCAPYVHEAIGSAELGTLRISPGPFVTEQQIDTVVELIGEILGG